jgi:hypothetical protein
MAVAVRGDTILAVGIIRPVATAGKGTSFEGQWSCPA